MRVSLPSPRDVRLHRDTPDSLLSGVTALEGTLLELDRDSLRMDITRARSRGRWMDVAAPSGAVLANQPGTSVERRVISRSRTALVIGATWIAVAAVVHAGLGWP